MASLRGAACNAILGRTRSLGERSGIVPRVAGVTGLEPATFGVTGRRSNQLSYTPTCRPRDNGQGQSQACTGSDSPSQGNAPLTSTSQLGSTQITLQFDPSRNIDAAARAVQAAINAARGKLPANLPNSPTYRKTNPADAPIILLALTSDTMPLGRMYDAADSILAQKIAQVEGVGQVIVGGGANPAVRVQVNPTQLSAYGIGTDEVRNALNRANSNSPKGEFSGAHDSLAITADDQLKVADQYKPLVVTYRNGAPVRLD